MKLAKNILPGDTILIGVYYKDHLLPDSIKLTLKMTYHFGALYVGYAKQEARNCIIHVQFYKLGCCSVP